MYERFFQFSEKPFTLLPDASFLYLSKSHAAALSMFEYGLKSQAGFTVISGEIGSGKTTLIREVLNNLEDRITVGLINNTMSSVGEMLQWVLMAFGIKYRGLGKVEMYESLMDFIVNEYAQKRRTVLIIDEAQNLSPDNLEELRMLSNINADKDQVLQMVLVGQPELREILSLPKLTQFAQRVSVHHHLGSLVVNEVREYIKHRLRAVGCKEKIFEDLAIIKIWYNSQGIPRVINNLCDTGLVYAYADSIKIVDAKIISDVVTDGQRGGIKYHKPEIAALDPMLIE